MNCTCGHTFTEADRLVHRLACGDSTKAKDVERVMGGKRARMMWADPPYSRDYDSRGKKGVCEKSEQWPVMLAAVRELAETCSAWYVKVPWYDTPDAISKLQVRHFIVWAKRGFGLGAGDFRPQHEILLYGRTSGECFAAKDVGDVWEEAVPFRGRMLHVAETPVALIAKAIGYSSQENEIVLDPFLGSGTTLVACEGLGRLGFGIEIAPQYVAVALQRMKDLGLEPELAEGQSAG